MMIIVAKLIVFYVYVFSLCRINEHRNQFLRTIRQIIREDVRQMNILGFSKNIASFDMGVVSKKSDGKMFTKNDAGRGKCSESQHRVDHHDSAHKVPCGLCGKEVSLGQRQKDLMSMNIDGKQDLSSINNSH